MAALFQLSGSIKSHSRKQQHRGREMEMSRPSGGPHRGWYHSNIFQIPNPLVLFNARPTCYLDLAFCLGAGAATGAGFEVGSVAGGGLTDS